jgi:hypothetical protein
MSWLTDAENFIKAKQNENKTDRSTEFFSEELLSYETEEQKEAFKKFLLLEYPNATNREIDKALAEMEDKLEKPFLKKEALRFLRVRLED